MSESDYPLDDVQGYDEEAEAAGWRGPELAFGLVWPFIREGQSILDIGIGTGLAAALFQKAGLEIHGMDLSEKMLEICRSKGLGEDLRLHDLTQAPYPFESESVDHAVCVGTLNFFEDLSTVFREVSRILRPGGLFVFVVADREENEKAALKIGPGHSRSGATVTMYRHSAPQVGGWIRAQGFRLLRSLDFTVPMDQERVEVLPAKAYVAKKESR